MALLTFGTNKRGPSTGIIGFLNEGFHQWFGRLFGPILLILGGIAFGMDFSQILNPALLLNIGLTMIGVILGILALLSGMMTLYSGINSDERFSPTMVISIFVAILAGAALFYLGTALSIIGNSL